MKNNQVDIEQYYQPGEIEKIKQYVMNGTTYNIKQEKLLFVSEKLKKIKRR